MKITSCCGLAILTLHHPLYFCPQTATYAHEQGQCPMPPLDALAAALIAHADALYAACEYDADRKRFSVEIRNEHHAPVADGAGPSLGAAIEGALGHLAAVRG